MNHIKAVGIKWIIVAIVTFSLFGVFNDVSISKLFTISISVAILSYLVGDLILLPRIGNVFASIVDFGITFGFFFVLGHALIQIAMPITLASFAAAFFISCTEPLFHTYLEERVFSSDQSEFSLKELQTEFAEESDPNVQENDDKN